METNYCAHAIDEFTQVKFQMPEVESLTQEMKEQILNAQKFRLPLDGELFDWKDGDFHEKAEAYCLPLMMPYEICALEFPTTGLGVDVVKKAIIVCNFKTDPENPCVRVQIAAFGQGKWFPYPRVGMLVQVGNTLVVNSRFSYEVDGNGDEFLFEKHCMCIVAQFIAALQCKNVNSALSLPPAALNKAREKRGNQPFFSYHILEIGDSAKTVRPSAGGAHESPRVHLRRGHIRNHPSAGRVAVKPCVVGNKELGMVSKDYRVKSPNESASAHA